MKSIFFCFFLIGFWGQCLFTDQLLHKIGITEKKILIFFFLKNYLNFKLLQRERNYGWQLLFSLQATDHFSWFDFFPQLVIHFYGFTTFDWTTKLCMIMASCCNYQRIICILVIYHLNAVIYVDSLLLIYCFRMER